MSELVDLLAKKFIARRDIKAVQNAKGDEYWPVVMCECGRKNCYRPQHRGMTRTNLPWERVDIENHLAGTETYGHYLLSENDECKLFAFDIDLEAEGVYPETFPHSNAAGYKGKFIEFNPREAWRNRAHPARGWMKYQFKMLASGLGTIIKHELDIPWAVAYSGSKGIHVYGFTGLVPAPDARDAAQIVLDAYTGLETFRGEHFFKFENRDPIDSFPNVSIEVFPKQKTLSGKSMGNLMRLPLGRNLKTTDPTFFVDLSGDIDQMTPIDPIHALTTSDPFLPDPSRLAVAQ